MDCSQLSRINRTFIKAQSVPIMGILHSNTVKINDLFLGYLSCVIFTVLFLRRSSELQIVVFTW